MNFILSIPIEARLIIIFLLGTLLGSAANWAIYHLAWFSRPISPWSRPASLAPPRNFYDRLPIFGWLGLRREAGLYGAGFWIRPMLLELLVGFGLAFLYWWETVAGRLVLPRIAAPGSFEPSTLLIFHLQFASHCVLLLFMLAASMIDVDEKIIPDEITIPGTLLGLLIAAVWPLSHLPVFVPPADLGPLLLVSPNVWPTWLGGYPEKWSLLIGLACWLAWCAALLPRTWYTRHGWRRAMQLAWARIVRQRSSYRILRLAVMGTLAIAVVWYRGESGWQGLLSALVGMAAAGGLVWMVRIIGAVALQREAMGFGDVTLIAMIGAFVGWQPCVMIFFLAPFAGLVVGVLRLILFRDKEIPYGPFLCLATLFLIVFWYGVWGYAENVFALGWIVPLLMLGCLVLMAIMLGTWRLILNSRP
jgi:prepilin signal peptidase PulO-like enzyme (type II secretory pathway)